MGEFILENLKFKKLNESYDLSDFFCSEDDLNDFIKKEDEALFYQKELMGITYLVFNNKKIVAFFTISMDSLSVEKIEDKDKIECISIKTYPSLKIGRLAVDKNYECQGIGSYLVKLVVGKANQLSEIIGCRFVVVNAKENAIPFYEKNEFIMLLKEKNKKQPTMILNIIK